MSMQIQTQVLQFLNPISRKPFQQLQRQHIRLNGKLFFASTLIPLSKAKVWIETPTGAKFPLAFSQEDGAFSLDILIGRGTSCLKVSYYGEEFSFHNIGNSLGSVFHPGFMLQDDLALVLDVERNSQPFVHLSKEVN
jgi:hypothetical protein